MALCSCGNANEPTKICAVRPLVHSNGSVLFDHIVYSDRLKLTERLREYRGRNPDCMMSVDADVDAKPEVREAVANLLLKAGFSSVGFLTEPRNDP